MLIVCSSVRIIWLSGIQLRIIVLFQVKSIHPYSRSNGYNKKFNGRGPETIQWPSHSTLFPMFFIQVVTWVVSDERHLISEVVPICILGMFHHLMPHMTTCTKYPLEAVHCRKTTVSSFWPGYWLFQLKSVHPTLEEMTSIFHIIKNVGFIV